MAAIHLRILGYVTTLALHIINLAMLLKIKREELPDGQIKVFTGMQYRYFTCWTIMLQILYAALGLCCDVLVLKNSKNKKYKIANPVRGLRDILFSALVWPCSMVVFTVFWSLFLYDRSLIFPEFIDKVISPTLNHMIHTAIVPIALWEVFFRPRVQPRSHLMNIVQLAVLLVVYLCVLYYTYITEGIWIYPIFKVVYGSVHFVSLHVCIGLLFLMFYFMQWLLNYIIHGSQEIIKKKIK